MLTGQSYPYPYYDGYGQLPSGSVYRPLRGFERPPERWLVRSPPLNSSPDLSRPCNARRISACAAPCVACLTCRGTSKVRPAFIVADKRTSQSSRINAESFRLFWLGFDAPPKDSVGTESDHTVTDFTLELQLLCVTLILLRSTRRNLRRPSVVLFSENHQPRLPGGAFEFLTNP